jgi:hypothetical protein
MLVYHQLETAADGASMRLNRTLCFSLLVFVSLAAYGQNAAPSRTPVADGATAVKIAEKALIPVYGKKKVLSERPFTAELKDGVWMVSGTLHCPYSQDSNAACAGGVAMVQISQSDGHILSMGHGK